MPRMPDFTKREKMVEEHRVMGVYPRGYLMEFVRPGLGTDVLRAVENGLRSLAGQWLGSTRTGRTGRCS